MVTVNIDIKDRLINDQVGEVFGFKIVDNIKWTQFQLVLL